MDFSQLLRIILITEYLAAELFACQVENAVADNVVAVVVASRSENTENLTAENILTEESGYRALSESDILLAPFISQTGSAGISAPHMSEGVIELTGIGDTRKLIGNRDGISGFPAVKSISHSYQTE